jgi:hypothetical protein
MTLALLKEGVRNSSGLGSAGGTRYRLRKRRDQEQEAHGEVKESETEILERRGYNENDRKYAN